MSDIEIIPRSVGRGERGDADVWGVSGTCSPGAVRKLIIAAIILYFDHVEVNLEIL